MGLTRRAFFGSLMGLGLAGTKTEEKPKASYPKAILSFDETIGELSDEELHRIRTQFNAMWTGPEHCIVCPPGMKITCLG